MMAAEDTERYREFIEKLQREEHRPTALNDLKNLLIHKPAGEAADTIKNVGIARIIQCLNVDDKKQFDLTCEVLRICFEKFEIGEVISTFTSNIMFLLRHEKECVRQIAIEEVYKAITTNPELLPVPDYIDIFVAVAQMVSDRDVGIANKAILITSHLPLGAYPKILEEMKVALEYDTSSKCNAFEVIVNISANSPELLEVAENYGYISFMLSELQSTDVLYQMNILELMSRLAITPHGIKFLVEKGALQRISEMVLSLKSNPLGNLVLPGYIKFFGCIARLYPKEIFEKYPALLGTLFDAFDSNDQTVLPIALDTLGFIGSSIEGKLSLAAIGGKYTQVLQRVCDLVRSSPTETKIRALHCMACLIGYESDPNAPKTGPIDHRVTLMTREWFRMMSAKPEAMENLMSICKNPFPEIRIAAFNLLDAVVQHGWGEELVARTPGFIEFLLDRQVDHTKECKEAKFDVIKKLSRSAAFDPNVIVKLTAYVDQGPFYTESAMQVAMEEGD